MSIDNKVMKAATKLITDGFAAGTDHDDIKAAMIGKGVPFSKINSLFKTIAIENKLMADPKVLADKIESQVSESDWAGLSTQADVTAVCKQIAEEVSAELEVEVSPAKVEAVARAYCKENEIKLPKKAKKDKKVRAKGGKIANAIVNLFVEKKDATRSDFYQAVRPVVLGHKNTVDNINMHYLTGYAIANGMSLEAADEQTKTDLAPALKDGVDWATGQGLDIPEADTAAYEALTAE